MICFVIYGVHIYVSKHKFNSFEEKNYDILMILVDFLLPGSGSVSLKRIRILLTKIKRIQTDPDPQHCIKRKWISLSDAFKETVYVKIKTSHGFHWVWGYLIYRSQVKWLLPTSYTFPTEGEGRMGPNPSIGKIYFKIGSSSSTPYIERYFHTRPI